MFLLHLWVWETIGIIAILIVSFTHLMVAEKKGYNACEWWSEHHDDIRVTFVEAVIGLLIWPLRIAKFLLVTEPKLYREYELRLKD